jgi:hypothetical protein
VAALKRCSCAALLAASSAAFAAGGHHSVDDAAILEPGQCEVETWFSRSKDAERVLHGGLNCRVGPIELGGASEYARFGGGSETAWGLQAKWAAQVAPGFSVGVSLTPGWLARAQPRYQGAALVGLLTWSASEQLAFHANAGRDFVHGGEDQNRWGVSGEWTAEKGWSVVLERYRERATHLARAGARWAVNDAWSVDASYAHRLSGVVPSHWTLGATLLFDRN